VVLTAKQTGQAIEERVCQYLCAQGLRVVEKNYTCPLGEIDLIMTDKDVLVFVEVRYRRDCCFGEPVETVTAGKQKKIIKTAYYYLSKWRGFERPCRFDIVAVHGDQQQLHIEWFKHAFGE
jgi:putative endonuclease